jgi:hypothetical protein
MKVFFLSNIILNLFSEYQNQADSASVALTRGKP